MGGCSKVAPQGRACGRDETIWLRLLRRRFHMDAVSELFRLVHSPWLCCCRCLYCRRYAQALIDREVAVLELAEEVKQAPQPSLPLPVALLCVL